MRRPLVGLRTIITGASSGIGWQLTLQLARRGGKIIAFARRAERLQELAAIAEGEGHKLLTLVGDVTLAADRARALQLAQAEFGGLDCLVNNAGRGALGPFAEAAPERLRQIMEVNFFAPAEFIREALPLLRQSPQPIVVNIGSVLGHRAVPGKSEYCASKFALHGLNDSLRTELGREGIDVLLVSPSTTASEFFDVAEGAETHRSKMGGGTMPAAVVARRIIGAIAPGKREIILSWGGNMLVWLDRLCPPLADYLVRRWG